MSHPVAYELRNPFAIDDDLSRAQRVCVVLGYEEEAIEVRKLRDSLLADAQEVCRFIEDLHPWTSFPFSEEVDIQQHHIAMFNKCINYTHDFDCPVRKRKHEALHNIALNWTGQFRKKGLHVYARWGQQPQDMRQRLIDAEWSMRTKLWLGYLFYSMLNMVII